MDRRFAAATFASLMICAAATFPIAGCAPTATPAQAQACPAGVPWVPDGYIDGK
jgi:hypothetical protein